MKLKMSGYPDTEVAHFKAASDLFAQRRDESGLGASHFPEGLIYENEDRIARISYNGRIWAPGPYTLEAKPLYDNQKDSS